jgi:PspA-Associated protein
MILRILGEGQFEVADDRIDELNRLDDAVQAAVDAGDADAFARALARLVTGVRTVGRELPEEHLGPSDLVIPGPDATLEEIRDELAGGEGLIPGRPDSSRPTA